MSISWYIVMFCLLGAIICLFVTLYSVFKEYENVKSDHDFYEKYYYAKLEEIKNYKNQLEVLSDKLDRYEKIFENIKENLPF